MIKHFYSKKWAAKQIKANLDEVYRDIAPTLKTVYFWINEFKRQRKMKRPQDVQLKRPRQKWGGGQNLERRNVERPVFRNFKITNSGITKDEIFDRFIIEFIFFIFYKLFE